MTPTMRFFLSLLLASPAPAADVLVVAADGTGDHTSIQAAVLAAGEGDTILIRSGTYGGFQVSGKSLSIVADTGAETTLGPSRVEHLAAGQHVLVRGLHFGDPSADLLTHPSLRVRDNAGVVLLEAIEVSVLPGNLGLLSAGAEVRNSDAVLFVRSRIEGYTGFQGVAGGTENATPNHGIHAVDSMLSLYDCTVVGGSGADAQYNLFFPDTALPPSEGRAAMRLDGGQLFAANSYFAGGEGGDGDANIFTGACLSARDGGSGIELLGGAVADAFACTFVGGPGGIAAGSICFPGAPGSPTEVVSGYRDAAPIQPSALSTSSPIREGGTFTITTKSAIGSSTWIAISAQAAHTPLPALSGVLVPAPLLSIQALGTAGPSGVVSVGSTVPPFALFVESHTLVLQAIELDVAGALTLGAPSAVVLLDDSF